MEERAKKELLEKQLQDAIEELGERKLQKVKSIPQQIIEEEDDEDTGKKGHRIN